MNISIDRGEDDNEILDSSMMMIVSDYNEAEVGNDFKLNHPYAISIQT